MKPTTFTTLAEAPDFLTIEEAAALLRIGRTAAYEATRRGELVAIRIGRRLRVPKAALVNGYGTQSQASLDEEGP